MNEWLLFVGFIVLSLVALIIALYPLRKSKKAVIVCGSLIILFLGGAYWRWGAFPAWSKYRVARVQQARVQAMLKTVGGTDDLIIKLKTTLQQNPQSARGWYLLGRLYASQNQLQKARDAFAKAHHLKPNQAYITVNYVHISGQGLFDSRRKPRERFAHGVQASISLIELILMSILYFNETSCQKKTTDLCKTLVLFNILYKALLTLSFGAGEIARDKYQAGKEIPEPISRSTSHNSLFSPNNPTVNDQSSSTREEKQDAYEML